MPVVRLRLILRNNCSYRRGVILGAVALVACLGIAMVTKSDNNKNEPIKVYDIKFCEDPSYDDRPQLPVVNCTCADPFVSESWFENEGWKEQHQRMIQSASASSSANVDLVFLGDSITERINGTRSMGQIMLPENRKVFEGHFGGSGSNFFGGNLTGIALGSSGDTSNNLLWHLQNGMMPDSLQPKYWFLLIGTNNLGRSGCSQESTVHGIREVIDYLQEKIPNAKIIIHGLLPRSDRAFEDVDYKVGVYWEKIQWINIRIAKKAIYDKNIFYMEAPDIFMDSPGTINAITMADGVHPSVEGLKLWETRIVEYIENLQLESIPPP